MRQLYLFALLAWLAVACDQAKPAPASSAPADVIAQSELVTPPFALEGEAEGLLLVWYDGEGAAHTAASRAEIPTEQRDKVRVDALTLAPEQRLDPAYMFVADLRVPGPDGHYAVRKVAREAFEAALTSATGGAAARGEGGEGGADIVLYGASWCGACKQAKQFFAEKGVPFIEKDIEKEPSARTEMLAKAKEQGVRAGGIPMIDVRGQLVGGFDPARLERLLGN